VQLEWKPFQIDPGTAVHGESFDAYCERRWGGSGWTNRLRQEGSKDGATFSNWKWWPNTLKAHQLVHFAQQHGVDTHTSNAAIFKVGVNNYAE
jgi:predicted DsbA family dithiol-disulfide isomerase